MNESKHTFAVIFITRKSRSVINYLSICIHITVDGKGPKGKLIMALNSGNCWFLVLYIQGFERSLYSKP